MMLPMFPDQRFDVLRAVGDHLWQSTVFACAAGALALALRKAQARIRYGLWLAASLKFLVPFALLFSVGSRFAATREAPAAPPALYTAVIQASQPFTAAPVSAGVNRPQPVWQSLHLPQIIAILWILGALAVVVRWMTSWALLRKRIRDASALSCGREVNALRRAEELAALRGSVPMLLSADSLEPGVFGVLHPVLVWPRGISEHLEDAHLTAILAHEVWHVRRRDNLASLAHMFVEAAFWFHPLVWWMGARLMEERERACDEAVLGLGNAPADYAESILKACKFCVESPLACVSGVSGSDLKRRIMRIMNRQLGVPLSMGTRIVLTSLGVAVVAAPVIAGIFNPIELQAQAVQAAAAPKLTDVTVKANRSEGQNSVIKATSGDVSITNATVRQLIELAYGMRDYQLSGGPGWIDTERFDVEAKSATPLTDGPRMQGRVFMQARKVSDEKNATFVSNGPNPPLMTLGAGPMPGAGNAQFQAALQSVLKSRFNLEIKWEDRNLPVYELVAGDNGAKITALPQTAAVIQGDEHQTKLADERVMLRMSNDELGLEDGDLHMLAMQLSHLLDKPVVDKTGLKGRYNLNVRWTPSDDQAAGISTALEDQLGLRLQASQAPIDSIVIERVDLPAEN